MSTSRTNTSAGPSRPLAADEQVLTRSGSTLTVGDLARDYGFTDLDGTQPEPFRLD